MKKLLFILLCVICSGCRTVSNAELKKYEIDHYIRGYKDGFTRGRVYQSIIDLKGKLNEI